MLVINYFHWSGTRDGLMGWVEAVRAGCEKQGVKLLGLYGPTRSSSTGASPTR